MSALGQKRTSSGTAKCCQQLPFFRWPGGQKPFCSHLVRGRYPYPYPEARGVDCLCQQRPNSSQTKRAFSTDRSAFITVCALNGIAKLGVLTNQTSIAALRIALDLHIGASLNRCDRFFTNT